MAAAGLLAVVWGFVWEPRRLVVREKVIALPCWRSARLRTAVVSDLHVGSPHNGVERLERLVERVNAGHPDLILLTGDFVIQGVAGGHFVPPEIVFLRIEAAARGSGVR